MKIKTLSIAVLFVLVKIHGQSFPGFSGDNYNGVYGMVANPANIADSRVKMDITLLSGNFIGSTDYISLTQTNIGGFLKGFEFGNDVDRNATNENEILANEDYIGPSFIYAIDDINSIGMYTRLRKFRNYNGINGLLFETILGNALAQDYDFSIKNSDTSVHMWGEVGFSYARVLINEGNHFFKAGGAVKLLLGGGSAQSQSNLLNGSYNATDQTLNFQGDISYVTTFGNETPNLTLRGLGFGGAFDVGLVYEFRTDAARSMAAYQGERERNKYKLKIGVSLLDYGEIYYRDQGQTQYTELDGSIPITDFSSESLNQILIEDFESDGITREGRLTVALPTSLQFNIDYKAYRDIYLNIEYNQTMVEKTALYNNNRINHLTITPRYERKNVGAFLPVSFSPLGGTAIGAGLRLGPLVIGSGSLLSNLVLKTPKNINVFAAVRIITHHVGKRR
ncbi:DUF5723 family protein [Maribacter sp. R77961]|uniref:DUF5723 family protein n=1 Tax=Maribacter sp. R77961 TaxID=3093871 RepID=UPI0037C84EA9